LKDTFPNSSNSTGFYGIYHISEIYDWINQIYAPSFANNSTTLKPANMVYPNINLDLMPNTTGRITIRYYETDAVLTFWVFSYKF